MIFVYCTNKCVLNYYFYLFFQLLPFLQLSKELYHVSLPLNYEKEETKDSRSRG